MVCAEVVRWRWWKRRDGLGGCGRRETRVVVGCFGEVGGEVGCCCQCSSMGVMC